MIYIFEYFKNKYYFSIDSLNENNIFFSYSYLNTNNTININKGILYNLIEYIEFSDFNLINDDILEEYYSILTLTENMLLFYQIISNICYNYIKLYDFELINFIIENSINLLDIDDKEKLKLINLLIFFVYCFVKVDEKDNLFKKENKLNYSILDIMYEN